MAVRFSADAQDYTTTASLPSPPFTICAWVSLSVDRNTWSSPWGVDNGTTNYWDTLQTSADGVSLRFAWSRAGSYNEMAGPTMTAGTWYQIATLQTGTTAQFYYAAAGGAITFDQNTTNAGTGYTAANLRIGESVYGAEWFNGRIAAFKAWSAVLTQAEIQREWSQYQPARTANLVRYHPFVNAETTDYTGNGNTLSGGSGAATEAGPPIPWRVRGTIHIPWDPTTEVWYAVYDTTSGELLSTGSIFPGSLPGGQAYKEYINGQPNLAVYEWDSTARDFVLRAGTALVDRVQDLLGEGGMAAVWADLSGGNSTTLQNRIGTLLGPYRYRYTFQDVDLQEGFGSPQ